MFNLPDYNEKNPSWYITPNFAKFFSDLVREKNLEIIVSIMEEIQNFAHNEDEIKAKWKNYLQEFDKFCEEKMQNPELSENARKEFKKMIKIFRNNLEISIKYSSLKNYTWIKMMQFKQRLNKIFNNKKSQF